MNETLDEPTIPPRLQRPLAAVWISLGLHAAVIALIQVAPSASQQAGGPMIEARLVASHVEAPLQPVEPERADESVEVVQPSEAQPLEPAPSVEPPAEPAVRAEPEPPPVAVEAVPAVAISTAVDLTYYTARELDVQPRALRTIELVYPVEADRQRLSGTVRLQLKVEADGRVSEVEVVSATLPGVFEASAVQAFRAARFAPAQKDGRPVRAQMLIEVTYDLEPADR